MPHLFVQVFSTAIDQRGVAREASLRGMQMVVPMVLNAPVELHAGDGANPRDAWKLLQHAAGLIQHVGAGRSRGAGRARLALTEVA